MAEIGQNTTEEKTPFETEEEIKVLERRLQLLRDGLKPAGGAGDGLPERLRIPAEATSAVPRQEAAREVAEVVEGVQKGEVPIAAPPQAPTNDTASPLPPAPDFTAAKIAELKAYEADRQIRNLITIAFERSVFDAVEIAKGLDDAYLLDALHDVLTDDDELHRQLVELGKLKQLS